MEICHKLLRKLGLECDRKERPGAIQFVARPGRRTQQRDRIFSIDLTYSEARVQLLAAARRKVSGIVSSIANEVNPDLLHSGDTSAGTPNGKSIHDRIAAELRPWFEPESLADVRQMFESASDPKTRSELVQLVPAPVLKYLGLVA